MGKNVVFKILGDFLLKLLKYVIYPQRKGKSGLRFVAKRILTNHDFNMVELLPFLLGSCLVS